MYIYYKFKNIQQEKKFKIVHILIYYCATLNVFISKQEPIIYQFRKAKKSCYIRVVNGNTHRSLPLRNETNK